jgi:hypothetical protein
VLRKSISLALLVLAATATDAAALSWTPSQRIAGLSYGSVAVAANQRGDAVLVWLDSPAKGKEAFRFVDRRGFGRFGAPAKLPGSPGDGDSQLAAIDPLGRQSFTWLRNDGRIAGDDELREEDCCDVAYLLRRDARGRFGRVERLTPHAVPAGVNSLSVADSGLLAVAGGLGDGGLLAYARPGRPLTRVTGLARRPGLSVEFYSGERAHLRWSSGYPGYSVLDSVRRPGGGETPARTLLSPRGEHEYFADTTVGTDASGGQVFAWVRNVFDNDLDEETVEVATRSATGPLTKPQILYRLPDRALSPEVASLGVGNDGSAALVVQADSSRPMLALRRPGRRFGPLRAITPRQGSDAKVAVGRNGRLAAVWFQDERRGVSIRAAVGTVKRGLGPSTVLGTSNGNVSPQTEAVRIDARGRVLVVWTDVARDEIRVATRR